MFYDTRLVSFWLGLELFKSLRNQNSQMSVCAIIVTEPSLFIEANCIYIIIIIIIIKFYRLYGFLWLFLTIHPFHSSLLNIVPFEVISSGCNGFVVPFQQLLEGPMEVILCERVNDLSHNLFHLLNCLIITASVLKEWPKVTGSKVWTIGRLRNCLVAHLGQIVCNKDGVVNWCIVLVEMPLTRFEERWPLPLESIPELS